ncbi:hypothetical protein Aple_050510 [Acrocarpospora pleiomorpha]|uniref:HTH gntR-type domain-containing protein n=1 Tax=Acrocarpospora pleiomorpha TaxID=90975 RepID=A0A5M3XLN5_9ACTN|nr:GntR family transcriptional regulator [Acrocarpospora pleiomorpha]GES22154.1 hypothetical protein Aple_050510 [Acrocarpospora pleiomorpha]
MGYLSDIARFADLLAQEISDGDYAEGLPTESALAGRLCITIWGARRVYEALRERGLVYTVQGKGSFVVTSGGEGAARAERLGVRDLITDRLEFEIRSRQIAVGARIWRDEMARDYGVGRETVRAALRPLIHRDLVAILARRGTVVLPERCWSVPTDEMRDRVEKARGGEMPSAFMREGELTGE